MKKITAFIVTSLLLSVLFITGCEKVKDEVVTIYNQTNVTVNVIAMAPEADVLNSKNAIFFCTSPATHGTMSAEDYFAAIPEEFVASEWYLYISGTSKKQEEPYVLEENVGAVFADDEVYGFKFKFDYEANNLKIVPLSGV